MRALGLLSALLGLALLACGPSDGAGECDPLAADYLRCKAGAVEDPELREKLDAVLREAQGG